MTEVHNFKWFYKKNWSTFLGITAIFIYSPSFLKAQN